MSTLGLTLLVLFLIGGALGLIENGLTRAADFLDKLSVRLTQWADKREAKKKVKS